MVFGEATNLDGQLALIKSNSFPVSRGTNIQGPAVVFTGESIPIVLYWLESHPGAVRLADLGRQGMSQQEQIIIYKDRIITNVQTEIRYQIELDKVKRRRARLVSFGSGVLSGGLLVGLIVGLVRK